MTVRVAVIGAGKMGKLHARVFSEMPGVDLVGGVDANPAAAESLARAAGLPGAEPIWPRSSP